MHLTIVGGTTLDLIFPRVAALPIWPEHTEFTSSNLALVKEPPLVSLGGNGANAAYVAARRGGQVTLHTQLAKDALGNLAFDWLRSAGCRVVTPRGAEASAVNVTAANVRQQRATFFFPGTPPVLPRPSAITAGAGIALVCGWPHPPLRDVADLYASLSRRQILTVLDTGPILGGAWTWTELDPVLQSLHLLLTNQHELIAITRAVDLPDAIRRLRRRFDGDVVIKRGPEGAWWIPANAGKSVKFRARRVKVVNTIGAGDTFNGALLAALGRRVGMSAAIAEGVEIASSVVASGRGVLGVPARTSRRRAMT